MLKWMDLKLWISSYNLSSKLNYLTFYNNNSNNNNSQSAISLRNRRTGLNPNPSGADSSTVSGRTSQLEFDSAICIGILSPEVVQANSGKGNKQPVRRI